MAHRPIDVIVPVYRNAQMLSDCVQSLLANWSEVADRSPRLVLVNDSPDDAPVAELLASLVRSHRAVQVLTNESNLGFVGAVNRGLAQARRDRRDALLVNSDTVSFAGTMAALLDAAAKDPQIGFASPRSNNASICSLPHFHGGAPPDPVTAHGRWAALSRSMPDWHFAPTAVGFYLFIAYAVLANHRELREDFGVGYEEENDLIMRAGKVGQRAVIVNRAFAFHAGSASFALAGLDLHEHRHANHLKLTELHPEFKPLVARYEQSAHFRAERLLAGLLPGADGRLRVVFDLTGLGQHYNGTNEHTVAVIRSLARRWSDRLRLAGVCSAESFRFHGLDRVEGLQREDPAAPGVHGVAVRIGQPFDLHHVNTLEVLAPVNIFAMLDTISEDCGPLAAEGHFLELWDHVAEHANGLLFNSRHAESQFCRRHPPALRLPRMARLLSTHVAEYAAAAAPTGAGAAHVLVLGNHFAHKGSDVAAAHLAALYPTLQFVVLGASTFQRGNLTGWRSGTVDQATMQRLFADACVVVLPSHMEGFGFGLMHALAAGKPVVARRIAATEEILSVMDDVQGVFLYDTDPDLPGALQQALGVRHSSVRDGRGPTWDDWSDGVARMCLELAAGDDVFARLKARIEAGDRLRCWQHSRPATAPAGAPAAPSAAAATPRDLPALLALEGREFVEHAYATLLQRPADDSGLAFYVAELERGVAKAEVLRALSESPEGRARAVRLDGLAELVAAHQAAASRSLPRRVLGRLLGRPLGR